jgi:hypothetical protein
LIGDLTALSDHILHIGQEFIAINFEISTGWKILTAVCCNREIAIDSRSIVNKRKIIREK